MLACWFAQHAKLLRAGPLGLSQHVTPNLPAELRKSGKDVTHAVLGTYASHAQLQLPRDGVTGTPLMHRIPLQVCVSKSAVYSAAFWNVEGQHSLPLLRCCA